MNIELINTGTELMLGRVLNTHQQWLCAELTRNGFTVTRQTTVSDDAESIRSAVADALRRAELVLTTGGLGPTSDDVTRELIADLLGLKLESSSEVLSDIERFFALRNRSVPPSATRQAMVPQGATVLRNAHGTAPGLVIPVTPSRYGNLEEEKQLLIMLPGPTRELRPMFTDQVLPLLRKECKGTNCVCRIYKTTGLGEVFVEERLASRLLPILEAGAEIGYCARVGEVEVRLTAFSEQCIQRLPEADRIVREQLGINLFAEGETSLEARLISLLIEKGKTIAVAESCTGGLIANRLTNVPGASAVFGIGLVTYSNEAKERLLGVKSKTLTDYGAVSEQTAREMAEGARRNDQADFALAVTGIAGPSGGSPEKPVGTVFIALATSSGTVVEKHHNSYDRETFKFLTSQQALDLLRRTLLTADK